LKLKQVLALNELEHRDEADTGEVRVVTSLMQANLRTILRKITVKLELYLAVLLVLSQLLVHVLEIGLSKETKSSADALSVINLWEALPPPLLKHMQTPRQFTYMLRVQEEHI